MRRASLTFEHRQQAEDQSKNKRDAEQVLNRLCVESKSDIRPQVPRLFATLVREMRKLDTASLSNMYEDISSKRMCAKAE